MNTNVTSAVPSFPIAKLFSLVSTPVLTVILVIFFILYCIMGAVLMYHWKTYGMGRKGIIVGKSLYLIISAGLFIIAIMALLLY